MVFSVRHTTEVIDAISSLTDQSTVSTMIQKSHGCGHESYCLSHLSFFSSAQDIFSRSCTLHQRVSLLFFSSCVHHSNGSLIHAFVSFRLAYVRSIGKKVDASEEKESQSASHSWPLTRLKHCGLHTIRLCRFTELSSSPLMPCLSFAVLFPHHG